MHDVGAHQLSCFVIELDGNVLAELGERGLRAEAGSKLPHEIGPILNAGSSVRPRSNVMGANCVSPVDFRLASAWIATFAMLHHFGGS